MGALQGKIRSRDISQDVLLPQALPRDIMDETIPGLVPGQSHFRFSFGRFLNGVWNFRLSTPLASRWT